MNKTKILICEGGDRLGKGTLIKGLCEHYDYKNVIIRHCDKPPKGLTPKETSDFQFKAFEQEFQLMRCIQHMPKKYLYHDNVIIYDRFYPGEYVYSQMFRGIKSDYVKEKILYFENIYIKNNKHIIPCLITLTADPSFFFSQEDGKSFSQNVEQKTKELDLFKEIHNISTVSNKLLLKVDENGSYRNKTEIFNDVINFINESL